MNNNSKLSCVVDANDNYVEYVNVFLTQSTDGNIKEVVEGYELLNDQRLLDVAPPIEYLKAHWNGKEWEETASPEEIAAHKAVQDGMMQQGTMAY